MREHPMYFPQQKLPTRDKTEEWYKKCLDSAEMLALYRYDGTSEKHRKMQVWENLYYDIIDEQEIERVFNPMQISSAAFPASIKNYPLSVPKIDLLRGEEIKRRFDWSVIARNEETTSDYSNSLRDTIIQYLLDSITSGEVDEKALEQKVKEVSKYYKYSYKNLNEISATRVLQYLWREQLLKEKFSEGFLDALVKSREIYRIDDVGGEPCLIRVDPKNVFPIRKGSSSKIEDADIIVELGYEPIGKIIDEFYDELSEDEVISLETGQTANRGGSGTLGYVNNFPRLFTASQLGGNDTYADELFSMNNAYNLPFDNEGNVRIIRVRWRGRKKLGKLTYFDPMTGDTQERLVSEHYKVNKLEGETVKWFWVNEAYEASKVADNIYLSMKPRDVQIRHFDNPSKCFLGYVGTDYEMSLMARMEPYQYLYNVYMRRLELAIAKYKGPIYELDITKKPDEWEIDQWMYYAEALGWAIVDPFNEGKKGASQGKMSGSFNTTGKVLDADVGNYIQQIILMLQYIEKQMGQIAGVTEQRQGQIDNRETVGGIERAVTQSAHITEKWFFVHDETKKRAMLALLDVAKATWKGKSKKLNFIMEDMARTMIDLSEDFATTEYDLFTSDATQDHEIREMIKQLSQAAVQNGASLTLPIDILRSDSISEMAKKIEESENARLEREENMQRESNDANERMNQATLQDKQQDRDLKYYEIDTNNRTKLEVAAMSKGQELPEDTSVDEKKLELQENKQTNDNLNKKKELTLKEKDLNEKIRHNQRAEEISKIKKETTSK